MRSRTVLKMVYVIWGESLPARNSSAIVCYRRSHKSKIAIAIVDKTHESRVFGGYGVVEKLDDAVEASGIIDPALGKESRQSVERGAGDALQGHMVGEEEGITKRLIFRKLLSTWEYPPERKRRVLKKK
jgi:hypothetical protein